MFMCETGEKPQGNEGIMKQQSHGDTNTEIESVKTAEQDWACLCVCVSKLQNQTDPTGFQVVRTCWCFPKNTKLLRHVGDAAKG